MRIDLDGVIVETRERTNGYSGEKSIDYTITIQDKTYYFDKREIVNLIGACRLMLNDGITERL